MIERNHTNQCIKINYFQCNKRRQSVNNNNLLATFHEFRGLVVTGEFLGNTNPYLLSIPPKQ